MEKLSGSRVTVRHYHDDAYEQHHLDNLARGGRAAMKALRFYRSPELTDAQERIANALALVERVGGRVRDVFSPEFRRRLAKLPVSAAATESFPIAA